MSSKTSSTAASSNQGFFQIIGTLFSNYKSKTPQRVKLIDTFVVFSFLTAAIQYVYVLLVGTFPFNSFLAGFFTSIATGIFAIGLRKQVNPDTKSDFKTTVPERAYFDFVLCCILTFLIGFAYMG